ncbi:MAG TPA: sigma-70 family RNA polymerase sigma factor [Tepidisphaeraceae bacterium]|nr:sigma-70 family RNA polymerase sigma factor [Tepidisphaeraceae bacterium]
MGHTPQDSNNSVQGADDYALMDGVRARNPEALAALYERYGRAVHGLCLRALNDPRDAEDLLIDIFSEIWERGDRFDANRGSPVGHIMGLARSRVVDRLRSRRSASRAGVAQAASLDAIDDVRGPGAGPLDAAIDAEQARKVAASLQSLTADQREALELAYFQALSHSEIAERLGQPLGTIKSRIRQALIHLREAFDC